MRKSRELCWIKFSLRRTPFFLLDCNGNITPEQIFSDRREFAMRNLYPLGGLSSIFATRTSFKCRLLLSLDNQGSNTFVVDLVTGAQPKAGTGLKMQTVRFFNVTLLGIYRWLEIYRWLVTFLSAHWLIEILFAIAKSTKHGGQSRERL